MVSGIPLGLRVLLLREGGGACAGGYNDRRWKTIQLRGFGKRQSTGVHGPPVDILLPDWAPTRVAALAEWKEAEWKTHVIAQQGVRSPT